MLRVIAAFVLMVMSGFSVSAIAQEEPSTPPATKEQVLTVTPHDKVLGDANAPIKIFEFASLSCSHCAYFNLQVLPKIKENYIDQGKVSLILRDFPLNEPALRAAQLTHCAKDDATYHRLNSAIFRTQSTWVGQKNYLELLGNIGKLAGITGEEYDACLNDKDLEMRLLKEKYEAITAFDIKATPSFVINGELYTGAESYEFYQELFDSLLKE